MPVLTERQLNSWNMNKILFLHGFFASGSCVPAIALRKAFDNRAQVLSPDLPMHPEEALDYIYNMCNAEHPDVIVGNSNGAFLAQITAQRCRIPALLGNPHFEMTRFLSERIGPHQYKSPRADGNQNFTIDTELINEFAALQKHQFDVFHEDMRNKIWGLFGENDTLAHYEPMFLEHYDRTFHFPGNHTPTADEVTEWYAPLAERLMKDL